MLLFLPLRRTLAMDAVLVCIVGIPQWCKVVRHSLVTRVGWLGKPVAGSRWLGPRIIQKTVLVSHNGQRVHSQQKRPDNVPCQFPLPAEYILAVMFMSSNCSGHTILPTLPSPAAFLPLQQCLPPLKTVPPAGLATSVGEGDALRSLLVNTIGDPCTESWSSFGGRRMVIEGYGQRDTGPL